MVDFESGGKERKRAGSVTLGEYVRESDVRELEAKRKQRSSSAGEKGKGDGGMQIDRRLLRSKLSGKDEREYLAA